MSPEKFQIVVMKFSEENENNVEKLYKEFANSLNAKYGETTIVYNGKDKHVVAAVEKILKLTE